MLYKTKNMLNKSQVDEPKNLNEEKTARIESGVVDVETNPTVLSHCIFSVGLQGDQHC